MNDPIAILKKDHREAAALLKALAHGTSATRRKTNLKLVTPYSLRDQPTASPGTGRRTRSLIGRR